MVVNNSISSVIYSANCSREILRYCGLLMARPSRRALHRSNLEQRPSAAPRHSQSRDLVLEVG